MDADFHHRLREGFLDIAECHSKVYFSNASIRNDLHKLVFLCCTLEPLFKLGLIF